MSFERILDLWRQAGSPPDWRQVVMNTKVWKKLSQHQQRQIAWRLDLILNPSGVWLHHPQGDTPYPSVLDALQASVQHEGCTAITRDTYTMMDSFQLRQAYMSYPTDGRDESDWLRWCDFARRLDAVLS